MSTAGISSNRGVKTRKNSVIDMKNILEVVTELRCDLEKVIEENGRLKSQVEKLERQIMTSNKKSSGSCQDYDGKRKGVLCKQA